MTNKNKAVGGGSGGTDKQTTSSRREYAQDEKGREGDVNTTG